ncbi:hypothetical protein Pla110_31430 [Polystyrenella longa]|uniref:Uncharacterized protein n=1 Tax=Polystyrenella longa TaxID=2528007 RepID=A0A518CQ83_9PLAN|nr:hypothetical protein Pla110_31430 [Polystyrenella longa]
MFLKWILLKELWLVLFWGQGKYLSQSGKNMSWRSPFIIVVFSDLVSRYRKRLVNFDLTVKTDTDVREQRHLANFSNEKQVRLMA